ncbi:MAG: DHA1 family bicyclomycin/chloramphenicol resistance-like MFS transporter [Paracoccaceae bacterium]|jgi:DHA1 family bicyclomycin/chloramphenicol resistance-like MFS transporter
MSDVRLHAPIKRLPQPEFVALMAMLFATIAFSIDAMLPALTAIGLEITPDAPNRAQLIITSFVLGMGVGTLFTGPLSDTLGRKPVVLGGAALYILGAGLAWSAQSLETVLLARLLQGLGAAGPRVVAIAIIRDLYEGRKMAKLISIVMLIFTLVPAFAPTLGAGIIWLTGWRGIFAAFIIFSTIGATWLAIRQPETLPVSRRRPFKLATLIAGVKEIFSHRVVTLAIVTQSLCFGALFANLSTIQPIFAIRFDQGQYFHLWFGLIAMLAGSASILNAVLVERFGMRFLITFVLGGQIISTSIALVLFNGGFLPEVAMLPIYIVWTTGVFFMAGMTLGNLNALAMEPMGHLAGLAASVTGSVSTIIAVVIAVPVGLMFEGTPNPLMWSTLVLVIAAFAVMQILKRASAANP